MKTSCSHCFGYIFLLFLATLLLASCSANHKDIQSKQLLPEGVTAVAGTRDLTARIDSILKDPALAASIVGIKVMRLRDHKILYEGNASKLFHPASTMKLFTAAAALHHLGPEYRFLTRLTIEPTTMHESRIDGDIFLVGSGDPSLRTSDLASLAAQLHSQGVRAISGNILCDDTLLDDMRYGTGWMWDDQPYKDFAPIGALSVNRNTLSVFVSPGLQPGVPAKVRILPKTGFTQINNQSVTVAGSGESAQISSSQGKAEPLTVLRRWQEQSNVIDIKGTIETDSSEQEFIRNIVEPALYTGSLFKEECEKNSIRILGAVMTGQASDSAVTIAEHQSAQLAALVSEMNKQSHNLYAELLLKALGAHIKGPPGTAAKGIEVLEQTVAQWNIDTSSLRFADGSGVSRYGLVSADSLTSLLANVYSDFSIRHEFIASLAIAGIDGSLKDRMHGLLAQRLVHAKTGSLSGVSALAGYASTLDGEELAFAIMMEHFIGSQENYTAAQDRICTLLSRYTDR